MTTAVAEQSVAQQAIVQAGGGQPAAAAPDQTPPQQPLETYNAFAAEDAEAAERLRLLAEEEAAKKAAAAPGGQGQPASQPAAGQPAAGTGAQPGAAAPAGAQPDAAAAAADVSKNTVTGALIALRRKNQELVIENSVLTGENRALKSVVVPGGQPAAGEGGQGEGGGAQPTIADELAGLDAQEIEIADQLDRGQLSEKQAAEQRVALRRRERELVTEQATQAAASVSNTGAPGNDLAMENTLTQLVTDYPIVDRLTIEQLTPFKDLAYQQASMEGKPIPPTAAGTVILRQRMANLAEQFYDPAAAQARRARVSGAQPGNGSGQPQGGQPAATPAGSQPTAAQREAKLTLAASHPPDIGNIGAGAPGGEITIEQGEAILAGMNDVDARIRWMDAHPQFVSKVLGRSAGL